MLEERAARLQRLVRAADRARPVSLAGEQLLPAVPAIAGLLPDGGLRRGTTVTVAGSTSLALALAAGPSGAGSWCVVVGARSLGLVAAAELGVALDRVPLITPTDRTWSRAVAAALDAFDLVLAWPVPGLPGADARRLSARSRERGAVLIACGGGWPERPDLRLEAVRSDWVGLGWAVGRLRARRLEIVIGGRGAASAERRAALWLPAPGGGIEPATDEIAPSVPVAVTPSRQAG